MNEKTQLFLVHAVRGVNGELSNLKSLLVLRCFSTFYYPYPYTLPSHSIFYITPQVKKILLSFFPFNQYNDNNGYKYFCQTISHPLRIMILKYSYC